jgi:hypothetical protein
MKLEVQTCLTIKAQLESKAAVEQTICIYGKNVTSMLFYKDMWIILKMLH